MGAHDEVFVYETDNRDLVKKRFEADCPDPAGCDNAEGYCGCPCQFGGRIKRFASTPFASEREAQEWVLDNQEKWDRAAVAAPFFLAAKPRKGQAERQRKLEQAAEARLRELDERVKGEVRAMLTAKSKTVTCSGCGSRLSRAHLDGQLRSAQLPEDLRVPCGGEGQAGWCGCPLCGEPLLSASSLKRISVARKRLVKARKLAAEARKPKATQKIGYVVGGWVAE